MIVTFTCQNNVFVYSDKSIVRPRLPFTSHKTIDEAKQHLKLRGVNEIKVIEQ
jgi:hypothetical protein